MKIYRDIVKARRVVVNLQHRGFGGAMLVRQGVGQWGIRLCKTAQYNDRAYLQVDDERARGVRL